MERTKGNKEERIHESQITTLGDKTIESKKGSQRKCIEKSEENEGDPWKEWKETKKRNKEEKIM